MSKAYDDGLASLYLADARDMSFVEDGSVDVICTSPPYWSLRKYGEGAELVWDGDPECEHEWGDIIPPSGHKSGLHGPGSVIGAKFAQDQARRGQGSQFCQLCGAWRGQLGLEPTIELYLDHLLQILDVECRRVLRDTGVMWINISDSYATHASKRSGQFGKDIREGFDDVFTRAKPRPVGLKELDLCMVPARFALAMQERGWYLRSVVVWAKPNPMPESVNGWRWERHRVKVKEALPIRGPNPDRNDGALGGSRDKQWGEYGPKWADCPGCPKCLPNDGLVLRKGSWRPTTSHEYIFMFSKTNTYYCDGDAVRESAQYGRREQPNNTWDRVGTAIDGPQRTKGTVRGANPSTGRNLRSVWTFPTQSYPEAHFATFPLELPERCIKASTSQKGNCPKCGMPWARVVERKRYTGADTRTPGAHTPTSAKKLSGHKTQEWLDANPPQTLGWRPSCEHKELKPVPAMVLDPFVGSGTTNAAATKLGRRSIGVDCVEDYLKLAIKRLGGPFEVETKEGVSIRQEGLFQ